MEAPGIEPGAFRMQSERDTTTPRARLFLVIKKMQKGGPPPAQEIPAQYIADSASVAPMVTVAVAS